MTSGPYPVSLEPGYAISGHVYLDNKVRATGTFDSATNKTVFSFSYPYFPWMGVTLSSTPGADVAFKVYPRDSGSATTWEYEAEGDFSGSTCVLGRPYLCDMYLTRPYAVDKNGRTLIDRRLQIFNITIKSVQSVFYAVSIRREGRGSFRPNTRTEYSRAPVNTGSTSINYAYPDVDTNRVLVYSDAEGTSIRISNDSTRPHTIAGIEYQVEERPGVR